MRSVPGGTTVRPSGLSMLEAILATDLLVATPTEMVSPRSNFTRRLRPAAILAGGRSGVTESVISR